MLQFIGRQELELYCFCSNVCMFNAYRKSMVRILISGTNLKLCANFKAYYRKMCVAEVLLWHRCVNMGG